MRSEKSRKQLALINALARVRRASVFAENSLRLRRHEILTSNSIEGRLCFIVMMQELKLNASEGCDKGVDLGSITTQGQAALEDAVSRFVAEPAQKIVAERLRSLGLENLNSKPSATDASCSHHGYVESLSVAQLAWGAFSLRKVLRNESVAIESRQPGHLKSTRRSARLELADLSIVDCAVRYQDRHLEYSFMSLLSADGAALVHRVAMLLASMHRLRIDTAIATAAKILVDPLVGGDADHCCSMLKGHNYPASWGQRYNLN